MLQWVAGAVPGEGDRDKRGPVQVVQETPRKGRRRPASLGCTSVCAKAVSEQSAQATLDLSLA